MKKHVLVKVAGKIVNAREFCRNLATTLYNVGINVKIRGMFIFTPNIIIDIVPSSLWFSSPDKNRRKRVDECFGCSDEDIAMLRKDHDVSKNYKGSLLDYICEIELGTSYIEAPFVFIDEKEERE